MKEAVRQLGITRAITAQKMAVTTARSSEQLMDNLDEIMAMATHLIAMHGYNLIVQKGTSETAFLMRVRASLIEEIKYIFENADKIVINKPNFPVAPNVGAGGKNV